MALPKIREFEYPVIDADLHILEGPEIFENFLEPKYQDQLKALPGPWADTGSEDLAVNESAFALFSRGESITTIGRFKQNRGYTYRMHMESEDAWQSNLADTDYIFPGSIDPRVRLWCMDQEGIDAGIVRNTLAAGVCSFDDPELTDAVCRAYNTWVHDFCSTDPNRLYAEALLPLDNIDNAIRELERCAAMGFKSMVVPGSTASPRGALSDPYLDPIWARVQELGWPVCVHATFNASLNSSSQFLLSPQNMLSHSGSAYFSMFINLNFMLDNIVTLGEITLGGMCDKFPNLNIYFIEAGHSWVGEVLYRLDKIFACPVSDDFMPHHPLAATTKPSEIFERQIYVPFEGGDQHYMSDMSFNALSKNLIWASDIPHWDADGPWEGVGAMRALKVDPKAEALIMGGNIARMMNVPYEKRVGTSVNAVPAGV
jgi:predicted TIM-barrel fold metal-dependent hydrolase